MAIAMVFFAKVGTQLQSFDHSNGGLLPSFRCLYGSSSHNEEGIIGLRRLKVDFQNKISFLFVGQLIAT